MPNKNTTRLAYIKRQLQWALWTYATLLTFTLSSHKAWAESNFYVGAYTAALQTDEITKPDFNTPGEQQQFGLLLGARAKYGGLELEYSSEVDAFDYQGSGYSSDRFHLNAFLGAPLTDIVGFYLMAGMSFQSLTGGPTPMASDGEGGSGSHGASIDLGAEITLRLSKRLRLFTRYNRYDYDDALLNPRTQRVEPNSEFNYQQQRVALGVTWLLGSN
jgi:hypothetical protein